MNILIGLSQTYKFLFSLLSVLYLSLIGPNVFAQDEGTITLRLFEMQSLQTIEFLPPIQLYGSGMSGVINVPVTAKLEKGRIWLRPSTRRNIVTPEYSQSQIYAVMHQITIREVDSKGIRVSSSVVSSSTRNRKYHGTIILTAVNGSYLDILNKVSKRDYIAGVVASESPIDAGYEMLQAQAVLAQTVLARHKGNALIGDSTQSQSYLGTSLETPAIRSAVSSVWSEKLYYKNQLAIAYYHSTCSGGTSDGAEFFHLKNSLPYLSAVPCKNCSQSPFWKPTVKEIPAVRFNKIFGQELPRVTKADYTNRPISVKLSNGTILTGYDFWMRIGRYFGWDKAPGSRFKLTAGENGNIIVESTGAGHGVGLCQWGASALAKQGKSYRDILRLYFPGCAIR
jgi:stage II sporulation protein D